MHKNFQHPNPLRISLPHTYQRTSFNLNLLCIFNPIHFKSIKKMHLNTNTPFLFQPEKSNLSCQHYSNLLEHKNKELMHQTVNSIYLIAPVKIFIAALNHPKLRHFYFLSKSIDALIVFNLLKTETTRWNFLLAIRLKGHSSSEIFQGAHHLHSYCFWVIPIYCGAYVVKTSVQNRNKIKNNLKNYLQVSPLRHRWRPLSIYTNIY